MQTTEGYIQQLQCELEDWKEKYDELEKNFEKIGKDAAEMLIELNNLYQNIDKLKNEPKTIGRWIPKEGEEYWFLFSDGAIENNGGLSCNVDIYRKAMHNVYKTKEIAERMKAYYLALEEARWYPTEEEWKKEGLPKNCMFYDCRVNKLVIGVDWQCRENKPYFKTEEECKSFYDKWQAEALIDWGIKNDL